jgi:hypothetical protein
MLNTATLSLLKNSAFGQIISGNYDYFLNGHHKAKPSRTIKRVFKGRDNHFAFSANPISDNTENFVCRSQRRIRRTARPGEHIVDELT